MATVAKIRIDYNPDDQRTETDANHIGNGTGYTHGLGTLDDTNSRFFRKSGSDSNAGTQASPYKTQNKAQTIVNPHGTYDYAVCLDDGIYDESHVLPVDVKYCVAADGKAPRFTRGYGARTTFVPVGKYTGVGIEYFVDGQNGNDAWNGLAAVWDGMNGPKATIQAGVNLMTTANTRLQIAYAIYNENVALYDNTLDRYIYAKEGEMPIVRSDGISCFQTPVNNNAVRVLIEGIIFDGDSQQDDGIRVNVNAGTNFVKAHDCTFQNCSKGFISNQLFPGGLEVLRSKFSECDTGLYVHLNSALSLNATFEFNYFEKCATEASDIACGANSRLWTISFKHNIANRSRNGFLFTMDGTTPTPPGWDIHNNTVSLHTDAYSNTHGMKVDFLGANNYTFWNNISINANVGSMNWGILATGAALNTVNCCYNSSSGASHTAGIQTGDPLWNRRYGDEALLGLRHDSPCFGTGKDGYEDRGANWNLFYLGSFISPNFYGITFDGQKKWFSGFRQETLGYSPDFRNCVFENFVGTGFVMNNAHTAKYQKNIFRWNGSGVYLTYVSQDSRNNIFYDNLHWGEYNDATQIATNHKNNVYFKNRIGLEWSSKSFGDEIKNSIFQGNTEYGIKSGGMTRTAKYCCIADAYNSLVDVTDPSNVFSSPLFKSIETGSEDFRIRTVWGGYPNNSPCMDAGDDGNDMGAWDITRAGSVVYSSYSLAVNPDNFHEFLEKVDPIEQTAVNGKKRVSVAETNRVFTIAFSASRHSPDAQTDLLDYVAKEDTNLLLWPNGNSGVASGTGTVNATAKTLTDAGASWGGLDRRKGYWVLISSKYYLVLSNTGTVLTLDDPDGTLPNGSYSYSINYVQTKVRARNRFRPRRPIHNPDLPRTGYTLDLIQA